MSDTSFKTAQPKTYVVSLEHRKARGSGHERSDEILCAARALFLEHGVENVTTRQIAARVGISQTALYVYFRSKEQILDRLSAEAFKKLAAAFEALRARDFDCVDFLRAVWREYIHFGFEHPDEYRLMFILRASRPSSARPCGHPQQSSTRDLLLTKMQATIESAGKSGELRTFSDPALVARSVWAALHGLVSFIVSSDASEWSAVEPLVDAHVDLLLNGLVNPEARREASAL